MSVIPIPTNAPFPMRWQDRIRNGKVPDWKTPFQVAQRLNAALVWQRKCVFAKSSRGAAPPQGAAAQQKPWRWRFRTGEASTTPGTLKVRAVAAVLPTDNASSSNPRWRMVVGATNSAYRYAPGLDTAPGLENLAYQKVDVSVSANTEYAAHIEIEDYCRIVSLMVYEYHFPGQVDSANAIATDHRLYATGNEITDAQHTQFALDNSYALWRHNGTHIVNVVPETEAGFWTRSTNSYVNMLEGSGTTVDANSRGFNAQVQYHQPFHSSNVACVFAAYARNSGAIAGGNVRLVDANGTLATLGPFVADATGEWLTTTVNLTGSSDLHKVDVHFQGDGTRTVTVHAVSVFEYVA
jgi:hypothetical protein